MSMYFPNFETKVKLLNDYMKHNNMHGGCTEKTFMHFEYMMYQRGLMPPGIYSDLYEKFYLKNNT